MTTTNLFVTDNVKQLRTGGSFRILLPSSEHLGGAGVLNSGIFNVFHNRVEFGSILEGLRNFGGGFNPQTNPTPLSVRHWGATSRCTSLIRMCTVRWNMHLLSSPSLQSCCISEHNLTYQTKTKGSLPYSQNLDPIPCPDPNESSSVPTFCLFLRSVLTFTTF